MKISEIITDKYKLRIPPTVYYELLADVQEVEEEQEPFKPMVEIDLDYVIKQKYIERDVLDKIRAEIAEYGSIMVSYAFTKDTKTDKGIEKLVSDVLKEAKEQVLEIIDKYKAESEDKA